MLNNVSIILVRPQMGENIGATARVMKNFGIKDLRLVAPRDGWPNTKAHEMAAKADDIIENAQVFDSVEAAIADLNFVAATASKSRDMVKNIISPEKFAEIAGSMGDGKKPQKIGIMFGKESHGLDNEDISFCNVHVSIPVSAEYDSMNLAMAVCLVCYEVFKNANELKEKRAGNDNEVGSEGMSTRSDISDMIKFLEKELTEKNFFSTPEKKPGMMVNIRNIFTRHFYTQQEVRTLRGIFKALGKK